MPPEHDRERFTAVHVWRHDRYRSHRAPINGYYAVGAGPEIYLRTGEPFPAELRA